MPDKQPLPSAEIDILRFFQPLISGTGQLLSILFRKIVANIFLFLVTVILISGVAFGYRFFVTPKYQVKGKFVSLYIPAEYCAQLLQQVNPQQLHIPAAAAGTIQSINANMEQEIKDPALVDSIFHNIFSVQLLLTTPQYIDTIQQGLIEYLEDNSFMKPRKAAKQQRLQTLNAALAQSLQSLDSLKANATKTMIPRGTVQGVLLAEPVDPVALYKTVADLTRQKAKVEEELAIINNITPLQPFPSINAPNYPNFRKIFLLGFLLSLVVATGLVLVFGKNPRVPYADLTGDKS